MKVLIIDTINKGDCTMSIKKRIKRMLGDKGLKAIRDIRARIRYAKCKMNGYAGLIKVNEQVLESPIIFHMKGKHVFFGYYDLQQLNKKEDKLLATVISDHADTRRDRAELGWYGIEDKVYHAITTTGAWCWQQGARLRWHPLNEDAVLFNDVKDGKYVMRCVDLNGVELQVINRACYDITPDFRYGLSLNYSRLQRLRPGYGYNCIPDATVDERAPANDGVFLVDIKANTSRLIITYEQLAKLSPGCETAHNYLNHISISPDGDRFIFFHLWTPGVGERWNAKLYTARLDGSDLQCLEQEYITSHYCWKNGHELLTTTVGFGGAKSYYIRYDISNHTREIVESEHLHHDGHPTFMSDADHFITDTYPLENCVQHLFFEAVSKSDYMPGCDVFHDPRLYEEKRCDLHPRLTKDNRIITIDSTCRNGVRSVLLFRRKASE